MKAEIPGVRKEDIHVSIEGSTVSISAETRRENMKKKRATVLLAVATTQCENRIGTVIDWSMDLDVPPNAHSRTRLRLYAPMTMRSQP